VESTKEAPTPIANATTKSNLNVPQAENGWITMSGSQRPDGTFRKPRKVRAGFTPPEEDKVIPTVSVTPATEEEEEAEIDILSEGENEEPPASPSQPDGRTSPTPKRIRPNPGFLSRVINSTNVYNNKILPQLLEEREKEKEREGQEDEPELKKTSKTQKGNKETEDELGELDMDVRAMMKKTTNSILKEIDKFRMMEGTLLLKQIAKRYGIKISILGPDNEGEDEEERPVKRARVSTSQPTKKGPQVKLKRVTGAIGYRSAMHDK
jgi:ribosomal protein S25